MLSDETMNTPQTENESSRKKGTAVLAVVLMAGIIAALLSVSDHPAHTPMVISSVKARATPPRPVIVEKNWAYSSTTVEMTGEKQDLACTTSSEGARLCFRKAGSKLESFLTFTDDENQFLCTAYHCTTEVKVDDEPVFGTVGRESPDGNLGLVYLGQPQQLLDLLKSAKKAELGPPMYEEDGLVLHFNVAGLDGFGDDPSDQSAKLRSPIPEHHDPRLSAPISPVFPPAQQPQKGALTTLRFGVV